MQITDSEFSKVALLCGFDTDIVDESIFSVPLTPNAGVSVSTAQVKFGQASAFFNGAGHIDIVNPAIAIGTKDFTLEGFIYLTSYADYRTIFDSRESHGSVTGFVIGVDAAGRMYIYTNGGFVLREGLVPLNEWCHFALVRKAGVWRIFISGAATASTYTWAGNLTRTVAFIGCSWPLDSLFTGYMDDLRLTIGTARYSGTTLQVPTAKFPRGAAFASLRVRDHLGNPAQRLVRLHRADDGRCVGDALSNLDTGLVALPSIDTSKHYAVVHDRDSRLTYLNMDGSLSESMAGDPYWDYTAVQLPFLGANNSTSFLDGKGNAVAVLNGAKISTAQSKFGGSSGYFAGAGAAVKIIPDDNSVFSGVFSVEGWIYSTSTASDQCIFDSNASHSGLGIFKNGGVLKITQPYISDLVVNGVIALNTWTHIGVYQTASTLYAFIDGVLAGSSPARSFAGGDYRIGADDHGSFVGYVDSFRITKGYAREVVAFAPPTAEYPSFGAQNKFYDIGGKQITVVGPVSITPDQFKFGTASAQFRPGGYLEIASSKDLQVLFDDFTLEAWVRPSNLEFCVLDLRPVGLGSGVMFLVDAAGHLKVSGPGLSSDLIGTIQVPTLGWTHISWSRRNGTLYQFVNGMPDGSASMRSLLLQTTGRIGQSKSGDKQFLGYMDDFMFSNGIARRVLPFAPPTVPAYGSTWNADKYYQFVALQLDFNEGAGAPVPVDSSQFPHIANLVGNAALANNYVKNGVSSLSLDGDGDYLSVPNVGTSCDIFDDFTVEAWVRIADWTSHYYQTLFKSAGINLYFAPSLVGFMLAGSGQGLAVPVMSAATWYHFAFCRKGDAIFAFRDGVLLFTATGWARTLLGTDLYVGGYPGTSNFFWGNIDSFRLTIGKARYTAAFDPSLIEANKGAMAYVQHNALVYDDITPV